MAKAKRLDSERSGSERLDGKRLSGKTALVTGGAKGIGRAIAEAFAAQGASICIMDMDGQAAEQTASELPGNGGEAFGLPGDVTQPEAVEKAVEAAHRRLGQIDILINNAGIFQATPFLEYKLEDWRRMLEVNVTGSFISAQAVLRRMVPAGGGKIINMASIAGKSGSPLTSAYNASKHAVIGLTRCLAMEFAEHGITVNAICPGLVDTELFDGLLRDVGAARGFSDPEALRKAMLKSVPLGRMIQPSEIANLAVFLASSDADGMTGQAITISGGKLMD